MGNKSSPELTFSFLLMAALCLEASIIKKSIYYSAVKMNWTEARLYCQGNHIDLVTWNTVDRFLLAEWLVETVNNKSEIWIGLLRDPEKDSVWKWINLKTGEGITGDDVSQSSNWADGQQSSHCAVVRDDNLKWKSTKCSSEYNFYCSVGNEITHHNITLSWYNATQYCWENISDLATINQTNKKDLHEGGWIGLYREAGKTWSWIGESQSDYRNWASGEPLTTDCASFDPVSEKLYSNACSTELKTVCSGDNLVVVNENKTWEDALMHCRNMDRCGDPSESCTYRHKLLSLEYLSDYKYVRDRIYRATTDEVWTGLRFLGGEWWWENGQKLEDQGMLPDCPSQWKHCGTLSKHDTNNWIIRDCSERRNFVCYRHTVVT